MAAWLGGTSPPMKPSPLSRANVVGGPAEGRDAVCVSLVDMHVERGQPEERHQAQGGKSVAAIGLRFIRFMR